MVFFTLKNYIHIYMLESIKDLNSRLGKVHYYYYFSFNVIDWAFILKYNFAPDQFYISKFPCLSKFLRKAIKIAKTLWSLWKWLSIKNMYWNSMYFNNNIPISFCTFSKTQNNFKNTHTHFDQKYQTDITKYKTSKHMYLFWYVVGWFFNTFTKEM